MRKGCLVDLKLDQIAIAELLSKVGSNHSTVHSDRQRGARIVSHQKKIQIQIGSHKEHFHNEADLDPVSAFNRAL